ncbi:hypothetical protein POV27_09085 [Aureisphaera galaxeae]|uniref:hypothetical protein n=1 Tax=Aureisphaera galaxeae TaxID=1538023 RepID=UPI002350C33A|nr:hypothetical protein [Aureisphaera galaxeae]MDC8004203.1 hypothetical protein [Aureisphaera galaxeae]
MSFIVRPLIALLLSCFYGHAQIGINTTDPEGILDIVSKDEGALLPRVALTQTNVEAPVTNSGSSGPSLANGTMVYNTNKVNDVFPGYYYWQTNRWIRFDGKGRQFSTVLLTGLNNDNVDFSLNGANNYIDVFRLDRTASTNIFLSGILGGTHGKAIHIYNLSDTYQITLLSENNGTASSPENRFYLDQDVILKPGRGTILAYDSTVQRWIVFRGDN